MTQFPFSQDVLQRARDFIEKKRAQQVIFSDGTYQIEILDEKEPFWPFLQIGDEGEFRDFFCTCEESEKRKECVHLAAAAFRIFTGKNLPLHVRFKHSFWNALCTLAAKRFGFETKILQKKKGEFALYDSAKTAAFSLKIKTKSWGKKIENILIARPVETEENSIKFSKLSEEELVHWKKGNPSFFLRYELSFWADLAKWIFLQYEEKPFEIHFLGEVSSLPHGISAHLDGIEIFFHIYREDWPEIIPTLHSIQSPYEVKEFFSLEIQEITYDAQKRCLFLTSSKAKEAKIISEKGILQIDHWLFKPGKGFYRAEVDPLLSQEVIYEREVSSFFQRFGKFVQPFFKKTALHLAPVKAQYHLFFNHEYRLHVSCFVFEREDLHRPLSAYFGSWIFLENKGFYCLEDQLFEGIEKVFTRDEVSAFVTQNRTWLNQYEGFQTHLATVESHINYALDEEKLYFKSHLEFFGEEGDIIDFGEWIYLKEKGFYPKASGKEKMHIFPGLTISSNEISTFIRKYREELEQVKGFFSRQSPLEKAGLSIFINEKGRIAIEPEMHLIPPYATLEPKIFGDFIYVRGEGFSEIPAEWRLPPEYAKREEIPEDKEEQFLLQEFDALKKFAISIDPRLLPPKNLDFSLEDLMRDEEEKKIILSGRLVSERGKIAFSSLLGALEKRKSFLITDAGLIFLNTPRFNWLKRLSEKEILKEQGILQLSMMEWIRLNTYEEIKPPKGSSDKERQTRILLQEIKEHKTPQLLNLSHLKSDLRPYQKIGAEWLWFMYSNDLSVFLCDEMGLGKTHQTMALLSGVLSLDRQREKKYLVVCPTSVLYHWEALLKTFLPKMRVLMFYGAERSLKPLQKRYDLLLTSYGMLRGEIKQLWEVPFEIAIFDELQVAKNRLSQTHKALRGVKAKMRLGLTGTPIENRLLELKSLFDLILPTFFPPESLFKELFIVPIEKYHDEEKKILLSKMIKPFILRRKKAEVLKDLPEKIEEVAYCDLSPEQRELYKNAYLETKDQLIFELKDEKAPVPYMHVFSLFSKLKQICDHPSLIYKDTENFHRHESGKWDLFVEFLQEIRESNQKVVIFTQYLDMMDIIEQYLKRENIGFAEIRGSTKDRKQQIEKFARDPKCEVFVGSLQAAGVGIDLVAASVVIHYDRWWNPAKEDQATDRVHRIGQKRGVQVFKCVTKGTIEEHIHFLIEKKKGLIEKIVGYDNADELKQLTRDEIISLLHKIDLDREQA